MKSLFLFCLLALSLSSFGSDKTLCETRGIQGEAVKGAVENCISSGKSEKSCHRNVSCQLCETHFESAGYAGDTLLAAAKACSKFSGKDITKCTQIAVCR